MLESDVVLQAKRADRRNRIADAAARADHAGSASRKSAARPQGSEWLGHVCPVIAVFMEAWREGLADDERILLAPLRLKIAYTRATPRIAEQRGLMAADWLVRTYAPVWLNIAGLRVSNGPQSCPPIGVQC